MTYDLLDTLPKQLVITPKPRHGESYMGFVLRTAEANGYPSINTILRHASLSENEMRSARPPLRKLAPLYGRTVDDFAVLGKTETETGRLLPLMNQPLPAIYLRSKHARVCPDCVSECGHVQTFWELRHAVACPKHRCMAVSHCLQCHREIDWWRRGLTTCHCGYDFAHDRGDKVTNVAVLTLLEVMQAKLMNTALSDEALGYAGFPVEGLKGMSLATLLGILHRLENFLPTMANDPSPSKEWLALETAAEMLQAWPTGFYRYLERVHAPQANMQAKGLRGQFNSFYEAFFKNGLPMEEMEFLRKAFVDFGEQHWKQAAIHPQLNPGKKSNIVGIEGLAKAMGVRPSTARKLVKKGMIPVHAKHPENGRCLFDLTQQMPFEFAEGKSMSLDDAAKILDIPAAILRTYRSRGYYVPRHLACPESLYHERDVETLRTDLMKDCQQIDAKDELGYKTLRKIMLQKLGPSEVKAAFIDAVRKREIQPLGIAGNNPGDLVFDARKVKDFIGKLTDKLDGTVSLEFAKNELDVDAHTISALIKHSMLKYRDTDIGIRITEDSLSEFMAQYASCRRVAKLKGMPQKALLKLCEELNLSLTGFNTGSEASNNLFMEQAKTTILGLNAYQLLQAA